MSGKLSQGDNTWVVYRGPDGSRFYLAGKRQGLQGVEWARGVVGLDRPPTELVWLQEAHQNGADLVGTNTDVRSIKFGVNILGDTKRGLRDAYARWNRANEFDQYGRLFFLNSYSGVRFSDVLLGDTPGGSLDTDPALLKRFDGHPMTWVAPNPFFKGYTETFEFEIGQPDNLGVYEGPLKVRNLGDSYTYPKIFLPGPGVWSIPQGTRQEDPRRQGVEPLGDLDDTMITLPELLPGQDMWLDTDPRTETITMVTADGEETNLWAKMSGQRPRIKLLGDRSEDWWFSVRGGTPGKKAKMVVQPLYSTFS
ncbi:minor tail protein [Rhodococcus phage Apiary]|nr:minor tail protein [Rhodococcus phage Braxoaddie]WNM64967.1 minor tail protein [Rhodococcus phage Maselop]WNM67428.1 minor tail protein [Rhodococcus phage Polyyuki]WNM69852.1 minor tail protein [Rhodococcus phage Apiary]